MFGDRGNAFTYLSPPLAELHHDKLAAASARTWAVGSFAPAVYAGFSAIVDYLVALGGSEPDADRRTGLVAGMLGVIVYERVASSPYSERTLRAVGLDGVVCVSPLHCHALEEAEGKAERISPASAACGTCRRAS
ncbi:hypothetical protein SAZ11_02135 [Streptomyces sp. FXJ1.4098]|uniref:hypothetical protein n=1 Tax=Streptomyces sp. NPDC020845 TaxID=3365096 RepID=UPI0029927D3F|nr:hypothetical protein [Streptomyces sp. FXJ1.4098]